MWYARVATGPRPAGIDNCVCDLLRSAIRPTDTMPKLSSSVATFVFLFALFPLLSGLARFGRLPADELWPLGVVIAYSGVAMISGWRYAATGRKVFGWIHAALVLAVAVPLGLIALYLFLTSLPRLGGSGPNSDIGAAVAFFVLAIPGGLVAVFLGWCGLGVVQHICLEPTAKSTAA